MKQLIYLTLLIVFLASCKGHSDESHDETRQEEDLKTSEEETKDLNVSPATKFETIGFRKVHKETISFPVEKVFPWFEPKGRHFLYDNWEPTVLKEGTEGSFKGRIEISKYDEMDVLLKVTEHEPLKGHIQYLVIWDDFEIQRIDIFCKSGKQENTTELTWLEHNAGLYKEKIPLITMFVEEGYLVKAVQRYVNNLIKHLENEN